MAELITGRVDLEVISDAFGLDVVYVKRLCDDGQFHLVDWVGFPPRGLDDHVMPPAVGLGGYAYQRGAYALTNRYHAERRFEPQDVLVRSGLDHVVCCPIAGAEAATLVYGASYRREISGVIAACFNEVVTHRGEATPSAPGIAGDPAVTPRERTILYLLSHGFEDREIAALLFISPATVRFHLRRLQAKFRCRNRTHLATEALRRGLFS
jgi:DNA-binding CsgD family transcriptional regulator